MSSVAAMGRSVATRREHRVTMRAVDTGEPGSSAWSGIELHAAGVQGQFTLCGLPVGEILYQPWPPEVGGCYRCHVL